jgi:hypothetical protein
LMGPVDGEFEGGKSITPLPTALEELLCLSIVLGAAVKDARDVVKTEVEKVQTGAAIVGQELIDLFKLM